MIHLNQPLHQMLKTSSKVLLILLLTFGVFGCKNTYKVKDYLQDLANITGFSNENYLEDLSSYGIIDDEDKKELNKSLKGYFLLNTCQRYFDNHENYKDFLNENKVVDLNKEASISRNEAIEIIELLAKHINNKTFKNENKVEENNVNHLSDYELKDEILITQTKLKKDELIFLIEDEKYYKIEEVLDEGYRLSTNGDFFSQIEISAFEKDIDLADAEIIEYQGNTSAYTNNNYLMLKSEKEDFLKGFKLSYVTKRNGLDIRLEKDDSGTRTYFDFTLSNLKATYKIANNKETDEKSSYFKVNFNSSQKVGVSTGKYKYYYLDYRELDSKDFLSSAKKAIHTKNDILEASIPICTLKIPIAEIPTLTFNVDVLLNIYLSGKVELVINNSGYVGFECRNGAIRLIKEIDNKANFILGANTKAAAALNFNLNIANMRLCDAELSLGIKGSVSSILHLYDNSNEEIVESDIEYYALDEAARENTNVLVCGDVSLNWVLDVAFNTAKTQLYKFGLSKKYEILNKDDQIFQNKTHIENFNFVDECTRKKKQNFNNTSLNLNSDNILLSSYSLVIVKGGEKEIHIKSLPSGYKIKDLLFESENENIALVKNGKVYAKELGSTRIKIKTSDEKYAAYINILVSTG